MVENETIRRQRPIDGQSGSPSAAGFGVRSAALHAVPRPTRGTTLVTGALVIGAVVGGRAGYRVGNAISHRHDG